MELSCRSPHGERGLKSSIRKYGAYMTSSLPARGAWIEIWLRTMVGHMSICRSPHGERGLKSSHSHDFSVPSRRSPHGERGLKSNGSSNCLPATSRSPHGERGLKFTQRIFDDNIKLRRSPHGERGLKCCIQIICNNTWESLPARGAWIEIQMTFRHYLTNQSLPARGAWIEITPKSF